MWGKRRSPRIRGKIKGDRSPLKSEARHGGSSPSPSAYVFIDNLRRTGPLLFERTPMSERGVEGGQVLLFA